MACMSSSLLDLSKFYQQLQLWQHERCIRSAIVCLGGAKVGKTTTISYLLGYHLKVRVTPITYLDDDGRVVHTTQRRDIDHADPILQQDSPIGVGLDPITTSPKFYDLDALTAIVDSPGRSKRLGRSVDVANDIGQQRMLRELHDVIPLYLIKASCLSQPNYLKDQLQLVQRMFPVIDEVKGTLLFVFTYVKEQTADDILGLLVANLQRADQSDEALSPYISLMIDQVQKHGDTLLVRPLDGRPDELRKLLLERKPLCKGKVCYGSSIPAEALNEIQLAMHTEATLIKQAHREGRQDQAQSRLQVLRSIAMELKDTTLIRIYTQLQTSVPFEALETSAFSRVSAMLHQDVWMKTSILQDVNDSVFDEGLADSQHSLVSSVDMYMLDDATKPSPAPAQPPNGDWVWIAPTS